jgi:hypothetical protein
VSGDIQSLKLLLDFITKVLARLENGKNEQETLNTLLKQLAYWVRNSDTLVSSPIEGDSQLCDTVGKTLLEIAQGKHGIKDEYSKRLSWVVMINGFEIFYKSADSQFQFIKLLIDETFKYKKQNNGVKRESTSQFHYYLDCFNTNISPIQLFFICHFKYPQTFLFRAPLVCSEVKEFSVKFEVKESNEKADVPKPYSNKFMNKQQQFFHLLNMGWVLDCNLNEAVEEQKKILEYNSSKNLHLDSISEIQTCTSISQKEFCSPFTMYFLLDQKIDFVDHEKDGKEPKEEIKEEAKSQKEENKDKKDKLDEETEQIEDYVVDLYLNLFQNKSISQLLTENGYKPEKFQEEEQKQSKSKKKKNKKDQNKTEEKVEKDSSKEAKEKIEKANLAQKREILRNLNDKERQLHQERVNQLWNSFTGVLLKQLDQAREFGNAETNEDDDKNKDIVASLSTIRYFWKIFNRLIEDSLLVKHAAFLNTEKNREFLVK